MSSSFSRKLEAHYQKKRSEETLTTSKDNANPSTRRLGAVASMPPAPTVSPSGLGRDFEFIESKGEGVESPPRAPSPTFSELGRGYDYSPPKTTEANKDKEKEQNKQLTVISNETSSFPSRSRSPTFEEMEEWLKDDGRPFSSLRRPTMSSGRQLEPTTANNRDSNEKRLAISAPQGKRNATTAGRGCSPCGNKTKGPTSPRWLLCDICAVPLGAINGDGCTFMR